MRKKTPRASRESALASGWTIEPDPVVESEADAGEPEVRPDADATSGAATPNGEDAPRRTGDDESDAPEPRFSNAALVLLGVFGGLYLLYAWIWMSWAQFYAPSFAGTAAASGALGGALQQVVFWLAPAAPILWFIVALVMTRERGTRHLVFWIVLGAIVLVPLPVFQGVFFS